MTQFDQTVSPERAEAITERLVGYNRAHAPLEESQFAPVTAAPLHVFAVDTDGALIGGLVGRTHAIRAWLEISILWVDEAQRGQGIGRELMARAEEEARRRGCHYARLATSHFQAPGFYERVGYVRYGTLEDCPPGETVYYYRKGLQREEEETNHGG